MNLGMRTRIAFGHAQFGEKQAKPVQAWGGDGAVLSINFTGAERLCAGNGRFVELLGLA